MTVRKSFTASESDYADIEKKKKVPPFAGIFLETTLAQMCMSDNYQSFLILARRRVTRKKELQPEVVPLKKRKKPVILAISFPILVRLLLDNSMSKLQSGKPLVSPGTQTNEQDRGSII